MLRALLAFSLLATVATVSANEQEAETNLRAKIWEGYNQGWAVRTATTAELGEEEYRVFLVTLYTGNEYRILGVGDANVANIDIVLHDSDGNTIRYDETSEPQAEFEFEPTGTATYFVVVHARQLVDANIQAGVGMAVTYK